MSSEQQDEITSQSAYSETPYHDSSWEVIGEITETQQFTPLEIPVVPGSSRYVDPMFADYGGLPTEEVEVRWHLPEGVAYSAGSQAFMEDESVDPTVTLREVELEALKRASYEQGKQDGFAEAATQSTEQLQLAHQRINAVLQDLRKQTGEYLTGLEKKAVLFALEVAHKIIGSAVEINPEYIVAIIKQALALAETAVVRKIRVSPQDLEFIQLVGLPKDLADGAIEWEFIADEKVRAGCVVETSAGEIDFDLEAAWERIRDNVVRIVS